MLSSSLDTIRAKLAGSQNAPLLAAALLLAILPFELEHLFLMLLGGGAYYLLNKVQARAVVSPRQKCKVGVPPWRAVGARHVASPSKPRQRSSPSQSPSQLQCQGRAPAVGPLKKTLSAVPVAAPVFCGTGWEAEVTELLGQLVPTPRCEQAVAQIASRVKRALAPVFPEAEIASFVCGNLEGGKAFGVAVPEVDIVINVSPTVLMRRMLKVKAAGKVDELDTRALQKYAIRLCTERLVASSGLKFRRSAFRNDEPKVTFLAPATLGFGETSVPLDLSVNSLAPFYNAALLTECGQMEPRAKALILLVRRWAKDRGICHASKGHLPPYVWTLLTIYFLQVGVQDEGPLLPPVEEFAVSAGLMTGRGPSKERNAWTQGTSEQASVGSLFKAFFRFYTGFSWCEEAVAVKAGKRAAPALTLPLHIVVHHAGKDSEVGATIEDPFTSGRNLGTCLTTESFGRLKEELARADQLCAEDASLAPLLEPWAPAEFKAESAP